MKTSLTVREAGLALLVIGAGAGVGLACGGGGGEEPTPPEPSVARVVVSPSQASVDVGQTQQFTAEARDASGNVVSGVTFSWSSSNSDVATVNQNGLATGQAEGSAEISAEARGVTGTASLSVEPARTAASIEKVSGGGQHGVTTRNFANPLVVKATDENGDPVSDVTVSWTVTSGEASLASQSTSTGSNGEASVEVTAGSSTGPVTVEASVQGADGSPVSFDLDTSVALMLVGDNFFEDPDGQQNSSAAVSIAVGDTVLWEWIGDNLHTVDSNSAPSGGSSFSSGSSQSSGTFRFAPQTEGTWEYFCEVHPGIMTGSEISVSGQSQ